MHCVSILIHFRKTILTIFKAAVLKNTQNSDVLWLVDIYGEKIVFLLKMQQN